MRNFQGVRFIQRHIYREIFKSTLVSLCSNSLQTTFCRLLEPVTDLFHRFFLKTWGITLRTKLKMPIFTLHLPYNLQSRVLVFQKFM